MREDFSYLTEEDVYVDMACQALRPQPVIDALNEYYTKFNSCGERVKYPWGVKTEQKVEETREKVLKFLKLKKKDYFVSFTLNTTYGINLLLDQIDGKEFKKVITTDIEHNSPFLSTMTFAEKNGLKREVIKRNSDGSLPLDADFEKALVVLNCVSNIDGRRLENIEEVIKKVHKNNGAVIIDAAQAMAHNSEILNKTQADAICFSAHKMYAPSLGVMVVRKDFLKKIKTTFIGGGMVDDVDKDEYQLSSERADHFYTKFEPGLQAWGEIIAFSKAIDWLENVPKKAHQDLEKFSEELFEFLDNHPKIKLINQKASPVLSFYVDGIDSHLFGAALADEGIMVRTGYFCAHYYLSHENDYPPLIRISLGLHNNQADIDKIIKVLERAL